MMHVLGAAHPSPLDIDYAVLPVLRFRVLDFMVWLISFNVSNDSTGIADIQFPRQRLGEPSEKALSSRLPGQATPLHLQQFPHLFLRLPIGALAHVVVHDFAGPDRQNRVRPRGRGRLWGDGEKDAGTAGGEGAWPDREAGWTKPFRWALRAADGGIVCRLCPWNHWKH